MRINWGVTGFSLNAVFNGAMVVICFGFPQDIRTDFNSVLRKSNVSEDSVEILRTDALNTRLFEAMGSRNNLKCLTDRSWDEPQLAALTGWLNTVVESIRESET